jgi:hypothetical protein
MNDRPILNTNLDAKTFKSFYYLKKELVEFCMEIGLQSSGGKQELSERISIFLDTGEKLTLTNKKRVSGTVGDIKLTTKIESNFVCSEKHRAFFKEVIGNTFSFNVIFQEWLKLNSGKTYSDAVEAYHKIKENKKNRKPNIGVQFEYNTYIRDFFDDNKGRTLKDAIKCWKYK